MKNMFPKRLLRLQEINRKIETVPESFIEEENDRYFDELDALTRRLTVNLHTRCLVMLSGPSSSGKTTSALLLRDNLREMGVDAHTVSLDDFYKGRGQAPQLEDGSYDYETPEALNLPVLRQCMESLIKEGRADLPQFDFVKGAPAEETRELRIARDSVVIFEGIHALNPLFEEQLPQENLFKVFVNTISPVYDGSDKLLARRDLRLIRRLLRDERFRSSSLENTMSMWPQVTRGEKLYMFPYVDTVDYVIDTTHAYEPCVFAPELLPLLDTVDPASPYAPKLAQLRDKLARFTPLAESMLPRRTLLREFLGGGLYA